MSGTAPVTPPEIPVDVSDDERWAIDREISEGGPVPDRDDPVATRGEERDAGGEP